MLVTAKWRAFAQNLTDFDRKPSTKTAPKNTTFSEGCWLPPGHWTRPYGRLRGVSIRKRRKSSALCEGVQAVLGGQDSDELVVRPHGRREAHIARPRSLAHGGAFDRRINCTTRGFIGTSLGHFRLRDRSGVTSNHQTAAGMPPASPVEPMSASHLLLRWFWAQLCFGKVIPPPVKLQNRPP